MIATSFDFESFPNGNVRIEFLSGDGETIKFQTITGECFARILLVSLLYFASESGEQRAKDYLEIVNSRGNTDESNS